MAPAAIHRISYGGEDSEKFHRLGTRIIVIAAFPSPAASHSISMFASAKAGNAVAASGCGGGGRLRAGHGLSLVRLPVRTQKYRRAGNAGLNFRGGARIELGTTSENVMADDLKQRAPQDAGRISLNEEWEEVRYWTTTLGASREELEKPVRQHGNSTEAVKKALTRAA
jgi:hypothetical protein